MAQVVIVRSGDTIDNMLASRGVERHELFTWRAKVRHLNPHIGDLNRIWPGDRVLLPDALIEPVGQTWIWQNVFNAIPDHLKRPWNGNIALEITIGEDTISSISRRAFADTADRNLSPNIQRAVFLVNNSGALQPLLHAKHLPAKRAFVSMPIVLSKFDAHHWQGEAQMFGSYISQFDPLTLEMYQDVGPQDTYLLAAIAENLVELGASVGQEDIIRAASYGMAGVAGYAAAGEMALAGIDHLARQIYADAVKQFGEKVVVSKKSGHLRQVTQFIRTHPNYPQLMLLPKELPEHLLPGPRHKLVPPSNTRVPSHTARHFRKQYFQAFQNQSSGRYMGTIGSQLKGRISALKSVGRGATWYVPAVLSLHSVYTAPPELRMRTLFAEGFGVVGGGFGSMAGLSAGIGIALILGLGPLGMFIASLVFATAGGIALFEAGKWVGGNVIYDTGMQLAGQSYSSLEQYLERYYDNN